MKWHNGEGIDFEFYGGELTRVVLRESSVIVGHIQKQWDAPKHYYPTSDTAKMWHFAADFHETMTGALQQIVEAAAVYSEKLETAREKTRSGQ